MLCRKLCISSVIRISTRNRRLFSAFSVTKDEKKHFLSAVNVANGSIYGSNVCWHKIHLRNISFGSITEKLNPYPTITFDLDNSKESVLNTGGLNSNVSDQEVLKQNLNVDNFIGDAANFVSEANTASDTVASIATETLNLTTWLPPNGVYHLVSFIHESCPWWASIIAATCVAKAIVFPLIITMQKSSTKMAQDSGKILELQQKLKEAMMRSNEQDMMIYHEKLKIEVKKSFGSTLKFLWKPMLNGAVFSSFFFALREMANHPIVSMKTGGLFWFSDLTVADPFYILPFVTSATLYYVFKTGIEFGSTNNPMMAAQMKWMSYILPPVTFVVMINFPSALCLYWCTSNFISLLQSSLLRIDKVRDFFGIPKLEAITTAAIKDKPSFKEGFNQSWNQAAFSQAVKERKELYEKLTSIKQTK